MNLKRKFHQDLNQYPTPENTIATADRPAVSYTPRRKRWLTAPVAIAMAILLTVGVAAASVTVAHYLNRDIITENTIRLTEVPEGYVGIYNVEDLVRMAEDVRNGTNAQRYILMSDITFTDEDYAAGGICEGGWVPLDTYCTLTNSTDARAYLTTHSLQTFHGNGHVIRGLRIITPEVQRDRDDRYIGLFGNTDAEIIHLGLEDCTVTVRESIIEPFASYAAAQDLMIGVTVHVGGIAGYANYIGGCYVKGLTLDLTSDFVWKEEQQYKKEKYADTALYNLNVGGIAGSTVYADACYAEEVSIRVHTEGEPYAKLYAGLLAGRATSCVTSWAQGPIEAEGEAYRTKDIAEIACNYPSHSFPTVVPKESFEMLMGQVDAHYGTNNFYGKLFRAYFVLKDTESKYVIEEQRAELQALVDNFNDRYTFVSGKEETAYTAFYVFDPLSSPQELERVGAIITAAFATEEEYLAFCRDHNIRMGLVSCFTLAPGEPVTATDLTEFNLETLWYITDGRPRLRIFIN